MRPSVLRPLLRTDMSIELHVSRLLHRHPFLRILLSPALGLGRRWLAYKRQERALVHARLVELMAEDPVLRLAEFQGNFSLDVRSDLFVRYILDGTYESGLVLLLKTFLNPNRDVIDIGANVGFYSVLCGKLIGPSQTVLAVEPTQNALARLRNNIERNGLNNKVIVHEGAASRHDGVTNLHFIEGKEEYSSLGVLCHPSVLKTPAQTIVIQCSKLDTIVAAHALDPGFIKVDVEGAEHSVFEGMVQVLSQYRPIVMSEFSLPLLKENGSSADAIVRFFKDLDYVVLDPFVPTLQPGIRAFGDILCLPCEMATPGVIQNLQALGKTR